MIKVGKSQFVTVEMKTQAYWLQTQQPNLLFHLFGVKKQDYFFKLNVNANIYCTDTALDFIYTKSIYIFPSQ